MADGAGSAAAPGRNDPCPCGSGKRYKNCHGELRVRAGEILPDLDEAQKRIERGDTAGAEAMAHSYLAARPEHPEALRILAHCQCEEGAYAAALGTVMRAMRSLGSHALPAKRQFGVWTALNWIFALTLGGLDRELAARRHDAYAQWLASLAESATTDEPPVSIVVVVGADGEGSGAALESALAQTYRNLDLVVVCAGEKALEAVRRVLDEHCDDRLDPKLLAMADAASVSTLINAGVRASSGAYVNVLRARHRFSDTRVAALVRGVANRGLAWGFSDVEFVDANGRSVPAGTDARVDDTRYLLESVRACDTVGYSLIHQEFVAVTESNLFFSRALFDEVGGFRESSSNHAWDFALRAVWRREPAYVASAELRYPAEEDDTVNLGNPQREARQIAMFAEYYEAACATGAAPPNPHAPSMHHWGLHFLKTPFEVGHVRAFSSEQLERLAALAIERRSAPRAQILRGGLDLIGFPFGEWGLGENLRALAQACDSGAIPHSVVDVDVRLRARQADRTLAHRVVGDFSHRCALLCVNPDMFSAIRSLRASLSAAGAHRVGYWYWELESAPLQWQEAYGQVDEIWVATQFVADAIRGATQVPVHKIPPPIEAIASRRYARSDFRLPEGVFLFLFNFDFNSYILRKNPEATIAAFRRAFPSRRDVGLVFKCVNGANQPAKVREFLRLVADDDRMVVIDKAYSRDEMFGLQSVVDAFVSLHRSEGLGFGLAESMYLGKPVVGTGYSGNLEFMDSDNSCLVGYELIPVRPGEYLYDDPRFRWADPDVDHAAHHMRRLVDDGDFRARIAARGRHDIRTRFTRASTAALIRERLSKLALL